MKTPRLLVFLISNIIMNLSSASSGVCFWNQQICASSCMDNCMSDTLLGIVYGNCADGPLFDENAACEEEYAHCSPCNGAGATAYCCPKGFYT